MIIITQVVLPITGVFLFYIVFHLARIWYRNLTNGLGYIGGPANGSFVFGNFKQMAEDVYLTSKWRQQFGRIFKFKSLFGITELHVCDVKAIAHIVSRSDIYQRSPVTRLSIQSLLGRGILSAEGEEHRKHRRALNPAFGVAQIRAMTEIFVEKGYQLREIWTRDLAKSNGAGTGKGGQGQVIEVQAWLRRLTLDVIGQAGFNYDFDALQGEGKPNELNDAFTNVFHSPHANRYAAFRLAGGVMPILRLLPGPGWRIVLAARTTMLSIAARIVTRNKAELRSSGEGKRGLEGKRDLLSSLLKANLADSEAQRLSDDEVVGQIPAFFLAGHETTSSALSWALYALSEKPTVQNKLREELLTISTDNPTLDELNSLAYLDCVVRETMRLHSPVLFNSRYATQDDVLPLARPFVGKDGRERDSIPIKRGQTFHIPINAINTDPTIWGEDAGEFNPERWENIPDAVSGVPGVWGNLLTFFAGNHNCIGFRFSLAEMKAVLFVIIRAFEFEAALPTGSIGRAAMGALQKPAVLRKENGSGLPLVVKVYNA